MAVLTGNKQNLDFGRARWRVRALGVGLSSQDGHTENSEEESSSVGHTYIIISFILWRTKPAVKGLRDRHWPADTFRHEAGLPRLPSSTRRGRCREETVETGTAVRSGHRVQNARGDRERMVGNPELGRVVSCDRFKWPTMDSNLQARNLPVL